MEVDELTAPSETPSALPTDVLPDKSTTKTPVDYCALSATSQEENGDTTSTISNIPVDVVLQTPKTQIWRK